jgi:hypothetical protein
MQPRSRALSERRRLAAIVQVEVDLRVFAPSTLAICGA